MNFSHISGLLLGVNLFTLAVVTLISEFWTGILDSVGALEAVLLVLIVPLDRFCLTGLLSMWHERQSQTVPIGDADKLSGDAKVEQS